jgi:hypothetical protein
MVSFFELKVDFQIPGRKYLYFGFEQDMIGQDVPTVNVAILLQSFTHIITA